MHPESMEVLHSMASALLRVFEANHSVVLHVRKLTGSKTWLQNTLLFCAPSEQSVLGLPHFPCECRTARSVTAYHPCVEEPARSARPRGSSRTKRSCSSHKRFHEKATLSRPPWWPLSLLLDRFGCPSLRFHSHSPRALITAGPVHDGIRQGRRCILTHGLPRERARLSCAVAGSGSDR